jgi:Chromate transporter
MLVAERGRWLPSSCRRRPDQPGCSDGASRLSRDGVDRLVRHRPVEPRVAANRTCPVTGCQVGLVPALLVGVLPLVFGGAFFVLLVRNVQRWRNDQARVLVPLGFLSLPSIAGIGLLRIFPSFLKIGAIIFGSGYLVLAFLRPEFVVPGLLTDRQLLDAVAIGQVTPGPVFTTATFIGYLLAGVPGAIVATLDIFCWDSFSLR